jgi:hypothetical protein
MIIEIKKEIILKTYFEVEKEKNFYRLSIISENGEPRTMFVTKEELEAIKNAIAEELGK